PGGRGEAPSESPVRGRPDGPRHRRPLQRLQRRGRGSQLREEPPARGRAHLRPLDPGRAGVRAGREGLIPAAWPQAPEAAILSGFLPGNRAKTYWPPPWRPLRVTTRYRDACSFPARWGARKAFAPGEDNGKESHRLHQAA